MIHFFNYIGKVMVSKVGLNIISFFKSYFRFTFFCKKLSLPPGLLNPGLNSFLFFSNANAGFKLLKRHPGKPFSMKPDQVILIIVMVWSPEVLFSHTALCNKGKVPFRTLGFGSFDFIEILKVT